MARNIRERHARRCRRAEHRVAGGEIVLRKHSIPAAAARGAMAVIERVRVNPSLGHGGFCVGADKDGIWLLGGNQGDMVNVARFAQSWHVEFLPINMALPAWGDFRRDLAAAGRGKAL